MRITPQEITVRRFWAKVGLPDENGCTPWIGARQLNGYGRFKDPAKGKVVLAHRFAYELATGSPISTGLVVDHKCRNRACANAEHMETVTQRENVLRGESRGALTRARGYCDRGHELGGDNRRPDNDGCRTCVQVNARIRYAAARASGRDR